AYVADLFNAFDACSKTTQFKLQARLTQHLRWILKGLGHRCDAGCAVHPPEFVAVPLSQRLLKLLARPIKASIVARRGLNFDPSRLTVFVYRADIMVRTGIASRGPDHDRLGVRMTRASD